MKATLHDFILLLQDKAKVIDTVFTRLAKVKKKSDTKRERPDAERDLYWDIYRTDPLVGACVDFTISFVLGGGMDVRLFNDDGEEVTVTEFDSIVRRSKPRGVMSQMLKDGFVGGDGYIEKMYVDKSDVVGKFDVVSTKQMVINRDEKGVIESYVQELGTGEKDYAKFEEHEIVHYRNRGIAGEAYGRSDIEPITEVSEILRDMMIDLANFISTKAYPPILWKLGTPEVPWSKPEVDVWAADREDVEPGDQISVQGDVEGEAIGVRGETVDIQPYLTFFASLVVSGLRVPATLTSIIPNIGQFTADSQTNAYTRRINDIRNELAETLEVDLFDYIIIQNGYGTNLHSEVTWKKHDEESTRMAVNNLIQLVQNSIISREEARIDAGFAMEVTGELLKPVDKAEGGTPAINPEVDQNKIEDTGDDDGRPDEKRKIAHNST